MNRKSDQARALNFASVQNSPQTVEMQLNARYFRAGLVAIRTFLKHNPHFIVVVREFGLKTWQIELLSQVAQVFKSTAFDRSRRLPYVVARLEALQALKANGGVTLFLDADTVTCGSIQSWICRLLESENSISMVREEQPFQLSLQVGRAAYTIFPGLCRYGFEPGYNWGVILVHRTPEIVATLTAMAQQFLTFLATEPDPACNFRFLDQTYGNCYLFEHKIPVLEVDGRFNGLVRTGRCSAKDGKFLYDGQPSCIVHFISKAFRNAKNVGQNPNTLLGLYRILQRRYTNTAVAPGIIQNRSKRRHLSPTK